MQDALVTLYHEILVKFHPVFRFFFVEQFPNSADWFVAKFRFARQTATNSVVGHIFGVGDRHLNNILVDKLTGEVIHIDLGIAFDQGRALPVPERVPFRLTPAIVDGMGVNGVDGVFRCAAEESLRTLRGNAEYLLVVLGVVLDDPMFTWTVVPHRKVGQVIAVGEGEHGELRAKTAESVMVTCRRRIEGREMGELTSVEGQVARLIREATNEETLALMFHGWKPFI
jgi:ataxia telangiectasia mutated family protein